ncbi:hypothetical protein [Nitratiruptor tergarcus]|uniref:Uncharacterized protein n=1 Tax=Nitratiruptor tergarcus DSM 16512 TaxID=1069081 RepID=A0A1W1WUX3_9BACT|nr:hypothetical protein [Nitratiruptor tergarcus]SMC10121.1 hypothetical protein SAMN05660197_1960 [Nitratiruptor tergarcus DSM 16512]
MYKIVMDKMCGCAKKDETLHEKWLNKSFKTKEEAEIEALRLANHANANWCKKHRFYAYEEGDEIRISVEMSCPKEI